MSRPRIAIRYQELQELVREALISSGLDGRDADYIANDLVAAEANGKPAHGIIKLFDIATAIGKRQGSPVVRSRGPVGFIDGSRELGHLVARRMVEESLDLAREHGVGVVGAANFSYYARLTGYVQAVADAGLVAVMMNSAGPAAVVPFGGRTPVLGTNPISFGFPRSGGSPLVIDMATSAEVWSLIALARSRDEALPFGPFLDDSGVVTSDPTQVVSVLPFGGAKGSAIGLAVEILGGALMGVSTGKRVKDEYDLGALLIALDPEALGGLEHLVEEVRNLSRDVEVSGGDGQSVHVPGDRPFTLHENIIRADEAIIRRISAVSSKNRLP